MSPAQSTKKSEAQEEFAEAPWRRKIYDIIFEAETTSGKAFDVVLLFFIVLSIISVCLESVAEFAARFGDWLRYLEWLVTAVFTAEYLLRIICVRRPKNYIFSFFGIIDFLAILPAYLSLMFTGTHSLAVIRALRLLRIFRVFKLRRYIGEAGILKEAVVNSLPKIIVFLSVICLLTIIFGSLMYVVEGPEHGFTSIPKGMYWTIVTMTTVGYGDISPDTSLGQFVASVLMVCGYGIIAIPTGIVSSEMATAAFARNASTRTCHHCNREGHTFDAVFCKYCGKTMERSS
jgi:voltage-gated potassium channel